MLKTKKYWRITEDLHKLRHFLFWTGGLSIVIPQTTLHIYCAVLKTRDQWQRANCTGGQAGAAGWCDPAVSHWLSRVQSGCTRCFSSGVLPRYRAAWLITLKTRWLCWAARQPQATGPSATEPLLLAGVTGPIWFQYLPGLMPPKISAFSSLDMLSLQT